MLLTRNSDVHIRDTRVMRVEGDKVSMDRKWAAPEQTWEVAEAISNFVTLVLARVPRTLLKWLEGPTVTRLLGMAILSEMEDMGVKVLPMEPENPVEIAALKWKGKGGQNARR